LRAGESRLRQLLDQYGTKAVQSAARYAIDLAERRMRRALLEVDDGDYEAAEYFDDDGVGPDPVRVQVAVRVRGDEAEIDFSGTDRQPLGPLTTCWEETARSIIGPKMILDPKHPMNAGAMRPFQVLLPAGSAVLGLPPTSHSQHGEMGARIGALMLRVMSRAVPAKGVAPDTGTSGMMLLYGTDDRPGREGQPFGTGLMLGEGWGGTQVSDGISFCQFALANCRQSSIELVEKELPVIWWDYGITIDAAGSGEFRGGFAAAYTIEILSPSTCTLLFEHARFPAEGEAGGGAGMPSYGMLIEKDDRGSPVSWNGILPAERFTPIFGIFDAQGRPDPIGGEWARGAEETTGKLNAYPLEPGQIIRLYVGAPGGYGDPLSRDPARVLRDVANERVTLREAKDAYG
ncbi:MAG: hydantoinase B/oxoprolinase family protein, partial [bacterium]